MNNIIIISKCLKIINSKSNHCLYEFHFKGVLAGKAIRRVILFGKNLKRNEEYLLYVKFLSLDKGVLKGDILKHSLLSERWDQS